MDAANKTVAEMEKLFGKGPVAGVSKFAPRPVRMGRIFVLPLGARVDEDEGRCCEQAERAGCVCRVSWKCPTHGVTCIGSHD